MDPTIALIVAALVAGAQEVAGSAVKDTYQGLKILLQRRFAGSQKADMVLAEHEKQPQAWKGALEATLTETGTGKDQEIVQQARRLLAQVNEQHDTGHSQIVTTYGPIGQQTNAG